MLSPSQADSKHPAADVRHSLTEVTHDLEDILQHLGDAADGQAAGIKEKAGKALSSLRDLEQQAQGRLLAAGHDTQKFVHENPWMVIAAATLAAYAIGLLTRSRH
ncbi:MAG: DUF883 family protein [Castellaniella sp.]|nr:DUF883 family protein [Castellaniella sp.]